MGVSIFPLLLLKAKMVAIHGKEYFREFGVRYLVLFLQFITETSALGTYTLISKTLQFEIVK